MKKLTGRPSSERMADTTLATPGLWAAWVTRSSFSWNSKTHQTEKGSNAGNRTLLWYLSPPCQQTNHHFTLPNFRVWHHFRQWNILHKIWLIKYSVHTMSNKLQGDFFDWSPPSFSKYKFLYNLWNLEKIQASLHGNLYLKNLGGLQSKKSPCS